MARFSQHPRPTSALPEAAEPLPSVDVDVQQQAVRPLPDPTDEAGRGRFAKLSGIRIKIGDAKIATASVHEAARLVCMMPSRAVNTDLVAVKVFARFIASEALAHGGVIDTRRAFRRANVDHYLTVHADRTEKSRKELKSKLHAGGRVLHPQQYEAPRNVPGPRVKGRPATTRVELARLTQRVHAVPKSLGKRLQIVMDLAYGAGARSSDILEMRGPAIVEVDLNRVKTAVISLPNLTGGIRQVPVADPAISARLIARANEVGDALVLTGKAEVNRNSVNRVAEDLRRHGYATGVNPAALRNRWILDLATTAPASLLLQLADLSDLRVLSDQRGQLRRYGLIEAAMLLAEVAR